MPPTLIFYRAEKQAIQLFFSEPLPKQARDSRSVLSTATNYHLIDLDRGRARRCAAVPGARRSIRDPQANPAELLLTLARPGLSVDRVYALQLLHTDEVISQLWAYSAGFPNRVETRQAEMLDQLKEPRAVALLA